MNGPKCCGEHMVKWQHVEKEDGCVPLTIIRVWRCQSCGRERDLYPRPWRWIWCCVDRRDIFDGVFDVKWWLGSVGSIDFRTNRITLAIIPLNRIADLVIRARNWFVFCDGDKWSKRLRRSYELGYESGSSDKASEPEERINAVGGKWKNERLH